MVRTCNPPTLGKLRQENQELEDLRMAWTSKNEKRKEGSEGERKEERKPIAREDLT